MYTTFYKGEHLWFMDDVGYGFYQFGVIYFYSTVLNAVFWMVRILLDKNFFKLSQDIVKATQSSNVIGSSQDNPIVLDTSLTTFDAVSRVYEYLEAEFGVRGKEWDLERQENLRANGKRYDVMFIKLKTGTEIVRYFDKTNTGTDLRELLKEQLD